MIVWLIRPWQRRNIHPISSNILQHAYIRKTYTHICTYATYTGHRAGFVRTYIYKHTDLLADTQTDKTSIIHSHKAHAFCIRLSLLIAHADATEVCSCFCWCGNECAVRFLHHTHATGRNSIYTCALVCRFYVLHGDVLTLQIMLLHAVWNLILAVVRGTGVRGLAVASVLFGIGRIIGPSGWFHQLAWRDPSCAPSPLAVAWPRPVGFGCDFMLYVVVLFSVTWGLGL